MEQVRTGSATSQTGTSATTGRNTQRRECEKPLENETLIKKEDCDFSTFKSPKHEQPLKVLPAPPTKGESLGKTKF